MAKKRNKTAKKKRAPVRSSQKKSVVKDKQRDSGPEYMVQIKDPKMVRRDVLESLREVIIFMQGYENFRKVQQEKVILFTRLKDEVKELNALVEHKLRKLFPKGKLKAVDPNKVEEKKEEPKKKVVPLVQPKVKNLLPNVPRGPPRIVEQENVVRSDIDELESQLKDIENQLQDIN